MENNGVGLRMLLILYSEFNVYMYRDFYTLRSNWSTELLVLRLTDLFRLVLLTPTWFRKLPKNYSSMRILYLKIISLHLVIESTTDVTAIPSTEGFISTSLADIITSTQFTNSNGNLSKSIPQLIEIPVKDILHKIEISNFQAKN